MPEEQVGTRSCQRPLPRRPPTGATGGETVCVDFTSVIYSRQVRAVKRALRRRKRTRRFPRSQLAARHVFPRDSTGANLRCPALFSHVPAIANRLKIVSTRRPTVLGSPGMPTSAIRTFAIGAARLTLTWRTRLLWCLVTSSTDLSCSLSSANSDARFSIARSSGRLGKMTVPRLARLRRRRSAARARVIASC